MYKVFKREIEKFFRYESLRHMYDLDRSKREYEEKKTIDSAHRYLEDLNAAMLSDEAFDTDGHHVIIQSIMKELSDDSVLLECSDALAELTKYESELLILQILCDDLECLYRKSDNENTAYNFSSGLQRIAETTNNIGDIVRVQTQFKTLSEKYAEDDQIIIWYVETYAELIRVSNDTSIFGQSLQSIRVLIKKYETEIDEESIDEFRKIYLKACQYMCAKEYPSNMKAGGCRIFEQYNQVHT